MKLAAEQQAIEFSRGLLAGPFRISTAHIRDQWEGVPGHIIDIEYPRFESASSSEIANELSQFFAGRGAQVLIEARQKPWDQFPDLFPDIDNFPAMNGRWDSFSIVHATERLLSLVYEVSCYGARAAHPNSSLETYNFSLVDRTHRLELKDFFSDSDTALKRISILCIDELCREFWRRVGEKPDEGQMESFKNGAGENYDNFTAFTVSQDHFTFLFPPYQVSAYAIGMWSVDVSFYDLLNVLRPDGSHLLMAKTA